MHATNEFAQQRNNGAIWRAGHSVYGLCAAWNHVTRPYIPLTEDAHKRSRAYARACRNRMHREGYREGVHYKEADNGMLWPLRTIQQAKRGRVHATA